MKWGAALALLAVAAVAAASKSSSTLPKPSRVPGRWAERYAALRPGLERLETALAWPGLADFLTVVASQETWGRVDIEGDGGVGRGPYMLHTTASTMKELESLGYNIRGPEYLPVDVYSAAAAVHAGRLLSSATYRYDRSDARWSDVRAGWAIPSFTGNRDAAPVLGKVRSEVVERHQRRADLLGMSGEPTRHAQPAVYPTLVDALDAVA